MSTTKRGDQGNWLTPRAHRHHLPHYVWHITHRCHRQHFLLKFERDRHAWVRWRYAARKRYGLCVLDYAVSANQIHLARGYYEIQQAPARHRSVSRAAPIRGA